MQYKTY